jgi:cytochrome c oxidase subunit 2
MRCAVHVPSLATLAVSSVLGIVGCGGGGDDGADAGLSPVAAEGRRISRDSGCAGCHGADGQGGLGPAWTGLYNSTITLEDGSTVVADDAYLQRAITDPAAEKVAGFTVAMQENELSAEDVEAVVAYIRELAAAEPG